LAAWLESSVNNAVISAGGGMIVSCANLKRAGEIVYLKCDFDTILKRLEGEAEREKRPLAASIETLRERFGAREAIYDRAADRVIDATRPIAAIVETILQTPQS
ncbi:MAG: shikimate kinase, partial [Helicobacteraceae bacterium]|nr:shikimate kinase [Helicobacteraceae bacterium]